MGAAETLECVGGWLYHPISLSVIVVQLWFIIPVGFIVVIIVILLLTNFGFICQLFDCMNCLWIEFVTIIEIVCMCVLIYILSFGFQTNLT